MSNPLPLRLNVVREGRAISPPVDPSLILHKDGGLYGHPRGQNGDNSAGTDDQLTIPGFTLVNTITMGFNFFNNRLCQYFLNEQVVDIDTENSLKVADFRMIGHGNIHVKSPFFETLFLNSVSK